MNICFQTLDDRAVILPILREGYKFISPANALVFGLQEFSSRLHGERIGPQQSILVEMKRLKW
jgi:hypothetical protein